MANAIKNVAKYIQSNPESDETLTLRDFCQALETETDFNLHRLFTLKSKPFELALALIDDWRFDRHVSARRLQKYLNPKED